MQTVRNNAFIVVDLSGALNFFTEDMPWSARREMFLQVIDSLVDFYDVVICTATSPELDLSRFMDNRLFIDSQLREQYKQCFSQVYHYTVMRFNHYGLHHFTSAKSFDYTLSNIHPSGRILLQYTSN